MVAILLQGCGFPLNHIKSESSALPRTHTTSERQLLSVPHACQVEIKSAVPSAEYRTSAGSTKLFLGGLSNNTTKEMLEAHFGQFGTITDSVVMETNGVPRGFGFVSFETAEMANAACQYSPHMLDNKIVDVKKAEPRGSPHLNSSMMGQGFYPGMGMHQAPGPMRSQGRMAGGQAPPNANPQRLAYRSTEQPHAKDAKVFVGGLAKVSRRACVLLLAQGGWCQEGYVCVRARASRGHGHSVTRRHLLLWRSDRLDEFTVQRRPALFGGALARRVRAGHLFFTCAPPVTF